MPVLKDSDIEALLDNWAQTKVKISDLEKKLEKYKRLANRTMNSLESDILQSNFHTLKRKSISKTTICKRDVPVSVWEKYSHPCTYSAYYLTENK